MRIWIVQVCEVLPVGDGRDDRQMRAGCLASYLASRGHEVIWWSSAFDHFQKRQLFSTDTVLRQEARLELRLLTGIGYRKNISPARLLHNFQIARKFSAESTHAPRPNIIMSGYPTIELCAASVRYGRQHQVPVVLDMRDMWPDIMVDCLPRAVSALGRLCILPLFHMASRACAGASAIVGITEEFVDWGVQRAGRTRRSWDRAFPFAYDNALPTAGERAMADRFWDALDIRKGDGAFTVCYFATFGNALDLHHVIAAARMFHKAGRRVRFVLCGAGERLQEYRRAARDLPNVIMPGWVNADQIRSLMERSSVGLDPLPDRYDFLASINNKAVEYLSAGLPILSSPDRGVLSRFLRQKACGLSYASDSAPGLAAAITRLIDRPSLLRTLRDNATRIFEEQFSAGIVYANMADHLERIAASAAVQDEASSAAQMSVSGTSAAS